MLSVFKLVICKYQTPGPPARELALRPLGPEKLQNIYTSRWAVPDKDLEKLDTTHRRHLRRILNMYWPRGKIRNVELYKRCDTIKGVDHPKKSLSKFYLNTFY